MIDVSLSLIIIGFFSILYIFYKHVTKNRDYFVKRGVPFSKPEFFFGSSRELFFNKIQVFEFMNKMYDEMPNERISGFFDMTNPIFLVRDPEIFKQIAIKDFDSFEDHNFIIESHMDTLMGNSLFMLQGQKWREMRVTLSPAFTGSKMRHMFTLVRACAIQTRNNLLEDPNHVEHEMEFRHFISHYSSDVIVSCAYGMEVNSFKDETNILSEINESFEDLGSLASLSKIFLLRKLPWLMKKLDIEFFREYTRKKFTSLVMGNIEKRKELNISRPDIIDLLMNAKRKNLFNADKANSEETTWTDSELVSQAFFFFIAGYETSKWTLTAFAYELVRNPGIQERLIEEIDATNSALEGADVTYEELNKMKYMDMVLNEVLRLHPAVVFHQRVCTKDFSLNVGHTNVKILKGDDLWIPAHCYHHNPSYWPDPKRFDPERFSDENKANINPAHFIPFGMGPRQCIGNRFAQMEIKVAFYYLLKDFTINASAKTEIPMKIKSTFFIKSPFNGLHLTLKKRR